MTEPTSFTPREIVSELDRFIVGQNDAKRAVAIALRNRWRRQQLDEAMREEVLPKNILMIGPTGVGKTEIARRLSRLAQAPFIKVEATKFTEVGYVGRDVEQIIRDLVEVALHMTREKMRKQVTARAELQAEDRVLDALVGRGGGQGDAREVPRHAAPGPARRQGDRDPGHRRRLPGASHLRHPRHAGRPDGHDQPQRDAGQGLRRRPDQAQEHDGLRIIRSAGRRRGRQAPRRGQSDAPGHRGGAEQRHRLPRRDRQDHGALRTPGRRRQPRRGAARPAAADRGHHGGRPNTAPSGPTISCSSRRAPSTSPSRPTCCPNCKGVCPFGSSSRP